MNVLHRTRVLVGEGNGQPAREEEGTSRGQCVWVRFLPNMCDAHIRCWYRYFDTLTPSASGFWLFVLDGQGPVSKRHHLGWEGDIDTVPTTYCRGPDVVALERVSSRWHGSSSSSPFYKGHPRDIPTIIHWPKRPSHSPIFIDISQPRPGSRRVLSSFFFHPTRFITVSTACHTRFTNRTSFPRHITCVAALYFSRTNTPCQVLPAHLRPPPAPIYNNTTTTLQHR